MCKKLMYTILDNKKLDWLKREEDWKLDKIDFYISIPLLISFFLVSNFGKPFFLPMMSIFIFASFIGQIRHIKSIPADIESKLMYPMICFGFGFRAPLKIPSKFQNMNLTQ